MMLSVNLFNNRVFNEQTALGKSGLGAGDIEEVGEGGEDHQEMAGGIDVVAGELAAPSDHSIIRQRCGSEAATVTVNLPAELVWPEVDG